MTPIEAIIAATNAANEAQNTAELAVILITIACILILIVGAVVIWIAARFYLLEKASAVRKGHTNGGASKRSP